MKKYMLILSLLLVAGAVNAQFEGQIDMKVGRGSGDGKNQTQFSIFIKGGLLSFTVKEPEAKATGGNIIFRPDKNVLWIVNDNDKTYLEIVPEKEIMAAKKKGKKELKERSVLRKTGKSMAVAGYSCDELIAEEEDEVTTILGTPKLGNVYEGFRKAFAQWGGQHLEQDSEGWQRELIEKRIFPMKTVTRQRDEITETQEVLKVEQRSLSAALFEPPAGYKKQALDLDMGKMMKGMKNGDARSMSKEDLEKMMKQLKEGLKDVKGVEDMEDSTDKDDEDDDE